MAPAAILHYHIFKNAGTSVDQVLEANFGARWRNHDQVDPRGSVFADEVERIMAAESSLVALSSHQMRPPLPDLGRIVLPIVFLRHPLDRIRSVYRFDRRRGPMTKAAEMACSHDFPGYVAAVMAALPHLVSNAQVMLLTDAWDRAANRRLDIGPEGHFERARAFLQTVPVVGVVEDYDRSWRRLLHLIAEHHPTFRVAAGERRNVDLDREARLEERLDRMREELGDDLYAELEARNSLDFALHDAAARRSSVP